MLKRLGGMFSGLLAALPMSDKAMEKQAARMERADKLAANPVVGATIDAIAWTENVAKRALTGQPVNGDPPEYGHSSKKPSRGSSRNHARSIAEGMQDYLYSSVRPGQVIVAGGRRMIVQRDIVDAANPDAVVVRSGSDFYAIEIDVSVSVVELEDLEDE